uniref:Mitochondrial fission 1 protein n=1 Tax=Oryza nivara TaxID=4536 RepID=A0A0E0HDS4_ORYNI
MEAKIGKLVESVGSFFSGGDTIPWCTRDIIAGCEREVAEAANEEQKSDSIMRLSWALVHSKNQEDVNRGIGMLEASLGQSNSPLQTREKLYLLAVGHYRNGDYPRSRQLVDRCLEIQPDWRQALSLRKAIEDKIAKDGLIGIGIATTAVGLLVGGIAAIAARKNEMLLRRGEAPERGLEHRRELVAAAAVEDLVDALAVLLPVPLQRHRELRLAPRADDADDVVAVQRLPPAHHRVVQLRRLGDRQLAVDATAAVPVGAHEAHQEPPERVPEQRARRHVLLQRRGVGGAVGLPDGDEVVRRRRAGDLDEHPDVAELALLLLLQGLVGQLGVPRRRSFRAM